MLSLRMTRSVVKRRRSRRERKYLHSRSQRPTQFRFPNGESIDEVLIRARKIVLDIFSKSSNFDTKIAIVSHMITIKVLTLWMLNKSLENLWEPEYVVPNTGMIIFSVDKEREKGEYIFSRRNLETPIPHLK